MIKVKYVKQYKATVVVFHSPFPKLRRWLSELLYKLHILFTPGAFKWRHVRNKQIRKALIQTNKEMIASGDMKYYSYPDIDLTDMLDSKSFKNIPDFIKNGTKKK